MYRSNSVRSYFGVRIPPEALTSPRFLSLSRVQGEMSKYADASLRFITALGGFVRDSLDASDFPASLPSSKMALTGNAPIVAFNLKEDGNLSQICLPVKFLYFGESGILIQITLPFGV